MFSQLLKITLFTSLWLWLKPRWRGLLALVVFIVLVTLGHREYLDYVQLSGDKEFLVWSFLVKWVLIALGLLAYFLLVVMWPTPVKGKAVKAGKNKSEVTGVSTGAAQDDGFDFLRQKKQLQSRAEKLLERR
jgi:hypothetical protein